MSKSKHTPGRWKVHCNHKQMVHNDKVQIANMGAVSCFPVKRLSDKENEANAKLIAAAPELLECLKEIKGTATMATSKLLEKCEQAIAKAEEV